MEAAAVSFLRGAVGHLKALDYLPAAAPLFVNGGINNTKSDTDAGLIAFPAAIMDDFVAAASVGRVWASEHTR